MQDLLWVKFSRKKLAKKWQYIACPFLSKVSPGGILQRTLKGFTAMEKEKETNKFIKFINYNNK